MTIQQRSARVTPAQRSVSPAPPATRDGPRGASFADHLGAAQNDAGGIQLSAHAKQRVAQRGISLDAAERTALADAVQHLDAKGAQDAAVLRQDAAFVVNVPSRTVVTALDRTEMQQRVFTQIDSAMML